ncbi:MAG: orotate phosphoribosyltransferase [Anaerolineae bacterium]|uniref:orotate phosphoribosyltransferase n=1 Tax=Promineifilum sp. TaxID=2664178 RepID=UPI001DFB4793|nr:orotate phosphoribosyltransferase [Anaerolineales bacterium]MCO5179246.1 orotate phosphoribosyltransferase [Promineifilum sp.]MCW5848450.1 orotate phosphoribosyltransferase [Anaerolineae bacterium]
MTISIAALALTLHDIGAIQFGRFRLHSGRESRIYFDLRVLVSFPDALRRATAAYRSVLDGLAFDVLAATPLAGLPIGTALCLDMDRPLIYPRKTAKSYGTGKNIEGRWAIGQTAVVIDDLITSGDSLLETFATVKAAGLKVSEAVVLIDREQGGRAMLAEQGYHVHAVATLSELLGILQENGRLSQSQLDEVLSSLNLR